MLSYQHAFHAGNHADVLKHFVLTYVLDSLNKKDKPYIFFDTHSGSGIYDLLDNRILKTGEAQSGIQLLLQKKYELPLELNSYLDLVQKYLEKSLYPGSPEIECNKLKENSTLVLSELHPTEYELLKQNVSKSDSAKNKNVNVHFRNGFEMLNALTPPQIKRGAVLIDPSYEELSDYQNVEKSITSVYKKWTNGIFLLWYPLLAHRDNVIQNMKNNIVSKIKKISPNVEICNISLCVNTKDSHQEVDLQNLSKNNPPRLYGSSMLVINYPWKLPESSQIAMEKVAQILGQNGNGSVEVEIM